MPVLRRLATAAVAATAGASAGALVAASRPRRPVNGPAGGAGADPPPGLPPGRVVAVPGRGEHFVREAPGPAAADGERVPTVLLLHGWMYPADPTWFTSYGPLSRVARVVAVDLRGHGRGPRPAQPFRLVDVADDVAALCEVLGTGPVVAVGYSMGGPVAQLLWQRHPEVVAGLVLCATSASFSDSPRNRALWRTMGVLQVVLRVIPRHWLLAGAVAQVQGRSPVPVSRMLSADLGDEVVLLLPWILGEFDRDSAEDVAEAGREMGRFDARGWLPSVDVPTAVLITERDRLVPVADQRDLASRLPAPAVHALACDHNAPLAAPDLFTDALVAAVRGVVREAAGPGAAGPAARGARA